MNWREKKIGKFFNRRDEVGGGGLLFGDTQLSLPSPSISPSLPTQFIYIYITASWS